MSLLLQLEERQIDRVKTVTKIEDQKRREKETEGAEGGING